MTILLCNRAGWRAHVGLCLGLSLASLSLGGSTSAAPVSKHRTPPAMTGTPMVYFRAASLADCNVYMNYSYRDDPKFQLRVNNPAALSPAQAHFVEAFNAAFATLMRNRPDACAYQGRPEDLSPQEQDTIQTRCLAQEQAMGYAEAGWQGGRLPAPSNCISYRQSFPGVIDLLPRSLPTPRMSIEDWMKRANAGH